MAPFVPDPEQQRVLDHDAGALVVDGGFGTGKTVVLRERFARLIEAGADPERVALVVGSRRARDEARTTLLERLATALPRLTVVTMHGLAFHIVGERFDALGYEAPPAVLSSADQFTRVRELLQGEDPARWPAYGSLLGLRGFADEIRQFVIRAQEARLAPEAIERAAAERGLSGWRELARFMSTYLDVLDAASEIDFAGLLLRAESAARAAAPPFDHVLVDDLQDTTLAGEALLEALRPETLVVAGNLDAHVFSFQGTTDAPLRRSLARGPVVELTTEHRPGPTTVDAWRATHTSEEHAAIARELRRIHVEDVVPWRELAVVVRRFGAASGLLRALDDAGVPRSIATAGPAASFPATRPFVLALRWVVASPDERDALVEPLLLSELGRLSPAAARTVLRLARAHKVPRAQVLEHPDLAIEPAAIDAIAELRDALSHAERARGSVLDAFRAIWTRSSYPRLLVSRAETDDQASADLDAITAFADAISTAGAEDDPSVEAFLDSLSVSEGAPELASAEPREDRVAVLTAHATAGRGFDTVIVLDALEGDFPSISRPEPMFDLSALEGPRSRSEVNRERLADERRLFTMVRRRARRRLLLTATDPHGDPNAVTLTSRFAEELGVSWRDAPDPFELGEPVSVAEAAGRWRRVVADEAADPIDRLSALDGVLALGEDPSRWWFQRAWSGDALRSDGPLRLSYSRLSTFENCELQYVLSSELGLDAGGGHQAWVGRLVHGIIEDCENGKIERSPAAFRRVLEERWDEARFPSFAISEAELFNAREHLIENWFERYGSLHADAVEQVFEFEQDGAIIRGKIDRIGPVPDGGTRITDYKTGRSDNAGPPAKSLQLGIYHLAVTGVDELEPHRPIEGVELAFLGGKRDDPRLDVKAWHIDPSAEADYQKDMRERVSGLIGRIRELDASRRYVANASASCFFCRFQTLCPRYPQGGAVFPLTDGARDGIDAETVAP